MSQMTVNLLQDLLDAQNYSNQLQEKIYQNQNVIIQKLKKSNELLSTIESNTFG